MKILNNFNRAISDRKIPLGCDYTDDAKLGKLLKDKKLNTRYGGRYDRHIKIYCGKFSPVWYADRAALEQWLRKFGNIKFKDAAEKAEREIYHMRYCEEEQ